MFPTVHLCDRLSRQNENLYDKLTTLAPNNVPWHPPVLVLGGLGGSSLKSRSHHKIEHTTYKSENTGDEQPGYSRRVQPPALPEVIPHGHGDQKDGYVGQYVNGWQQDLPPSADRSPLPVDPSSSPVLGENDGILVMAITSFQLAPREVPPALPESRSVAPRPFSELRNGPLLIGNHHVRFERNRAGIAGRELFGGQPPQ